MLLLLALISAGATSLLVGEGSLADQSLRDTFFHLRTWRLLNSMLAGAALAMGGVLVQGLFRNPLASPSILGTTAGANLGGMLVLLLWSSLLAETLPSWMPSELLLPLGCVLGALFSLLILLAVIGQRPGTVTVLLTGFILTSLFLSIGGLLTSMAQERWELGRAIVAFTLGGVESKGAQHVFLATPMVIISFVAALGWSRHLDALLAGEEEAASLGVNVKQVRRWVIIWVAMLTAAAVSIGGNVAFVGLVVPHALRPFIGVSHRQLVPAALVGGAAFLAWADVLTRLVPTTGPMPLGVITGLVGAPLFLILLKRASREGRIA
ncbi:MAG: FecCD family ABC transporter permease [Myxococcota bacterium]